MNRRQRILSRLDRLPFPGALILGVLAGIGLGALGVAAGTYGLWGAAAVGGLAVALALTAQPVWVTEPPDEPFPVPSEPPDLWKMVSIEGGTFLMGSPEEEDGHLDNERQHEVTVSPFLMAATTVTWTQYREIMEIDVASGLGGDEHPVTRVRWLDAVRFCNRASEKAGFEHCYRIEGEKVEWVEGNGYRLPTEAEWEYAARAGTQTRWYYGDDEARLGEYAWFGGNSDNEAHPVAKLETNLWGLFDMHGNVWEWCWDFFGDYPTESVTDPRGPASSALRVLRGGSFDLDPRKLRSAFRNWYQPVGWNGLIGFRCARILRRPS